MDKRYQVFVSSTYEDLQDERKEVMQALLELDCIPAGMELFPASNDDQWTLIKKVIDDSDYYILIVGGRYGSTNANEKSYTQMEFEYALSTGKPIISFLHKNPDEIPTGKTEQDLEKKKKLEAFKELTKQKLIKYWDSPENLGSVVSRSMVRLIKDFPAEGWVKSNSVVDEGSVKEIARLQKENQELKAQVQSIATEAPKGSDVFSQGEESFEVKCNFCADDVDEGDKYRFEHILEFTWNEIFKHIAANMIFGENENSIKDRLDELVEDRFFEKDIDTSYPKYENFDDFRISTESFDLIKIQFRALGLIELKQRPQNTSLLWKLTQYGDFAMTQALAIKRKTGDQP